MINEIWRTLPDDAEAMFMVSNHGRIQNMLSREIMETFLDDGEEGCLYVSLNTGEYAVHELVADTFICCIDCDFWEIVHRDGDPKNNMIWNLDMRIDERALEQWRNNCE